MDEERIAYCGVDCSRCADHADGTCPGCRQTDWQAGEACLPVACCRERGIAFCGACPGFPCGEMKEFYRESESHERAYARMIAMREGS